VAGQYLISYTDDTAGMTSAVDAELPAAWIGHGTITRPAMNCT